MLTFAVSTKNRERLLDGDIAEAFLPSGAQASRRAKFALGRALYSGWNAAGSLGEREEFPAKRCQACGLLNQAADGYGHRLVLSSNPSSAVRLRSGVHSQVANLGLLSFPDSSSDQRGAASRNASTSLFSLDTSSSFCRRILRPPSILNLGLNVTLDLTTCALLNSSSVSMALSCGSRSTMSLPEEPYPVLTERAATDHLSQKIKGDLIQ